VRLAFGLQSGQPGATGPRPPRPRPDLAHHCVHGPQRSPLDPGAVGATPGRGGRRPGVEGVDRGVGDGWRGDPGPL